MLLGAGAISLSLFLVNIVNVNYSTLTKSEASIFLHQQDATGGWVGFDRNSSDRNRTIKSVIKFQKQGEIALEFFLKDHAKVKKIHYTVSCGERSYSLFIDENRSATVTFWVYPKDKIEIVTKKFESQDGYWGTLSTIFTEYMVTPEQLFAVIGLWILFFIFLVRQHYSYLAVISYFIFLLLLWMEQLQNTSLNIDLMLGYTVLLFFTTLLLVGIFQLFYRFRVSFLISWILIGLLLSLPLLFIFYQLNFDATVTKETLYAIFQSNGGESYEYITNFVHPLYLVAFFVMLFVIGILLYRQERVMVKRYKKIGSLCFMVVGFGLLSYLLIHHMKSANLVGDACISYYEELNKFKAMRDKRKSNSLSFDAKKKEQGETYLVIIGESLNRKYMGLYGYFRENTPHLTQMNRDKNLMVFDNIYSNHVHTMSVLSYALTEANQYNHKSYYNSLSIIDILNQSDIETYWLTNQPLYGGWDNMVSILAHSTNHLKGLNHTIGKHTNTQAYDGVLLESAKSILSEKTTKNRVVFVHLMGNHSTYSTRYPKTFEKYKGEEKKSHINSYDNSVYYNDYVVSSLMGLLDETNQSISASIYLSDHGEEVEKNYGHNIDRFTYEMTCIPMLVWLSKGYEERYPKIRENLEGQKSHIFTNDLLYDTLIGLVGVETKHYNSKYDLTSVKYGLKESDALLNHGERKVQALDNYLYWDRKKAEKY